MREINEVTRKYPQTSYESYLLQQRQSEMKILNLQGTFKSQICLRERKLSLLSLFIIIKPVYTPIAFDFPVNICNNS